MGFKGFCRGFLRLGILVLGCFRGLPFQAEGLGWGFGETCSVTPGPLQKVLCDAKGGHIKWLANVQMSASTLALLASS